jgi:hypothetical protein
MTRRIKVKTPGARRTATKLPSTRRIAHADVAHALGAEAVPGDQQASSAALSRLRRHLSTALKSTGGRPGLEGAERRQKVPMSDEDWNDLQKIAESFATSEGGPTAGQVASQLLHDALQALAGGKAAAEGRDQQGEPTLLKVKDSARPVYQRGAGADLDAALLRNRLGLLLDDLVVVAERWRVEGKAHGRAEGQRQLLIHQLNHKFGDLPSAVTERILRGSEAELVRWAESLLSATSVNAVFK